MNIAALHRRIDRVNSALIKSLQGHVLICGPPDACCQAAAGEAEVGRCITAVAFDVERLLGTIDRVEQYLKIGLSNI